MFAPWLSYFFSLICTHHIQFMIKNKILAWSATAADPYTLAFFRFLGGIGVAISTHWVLAVIILSMVSVLFSTIGPGTLFFNFSIMMVIQLEFVLKIKPEIKGLPLEMLSKKLIRNEH